MVALTRRAIMCPINLAEIFTALEEMERTRSEVSIVPTTFWGLHPKAGTYLATSLKVFRLVMVVPLET